MFKLLSIIIGGYILYRLFTKSNTLAPGNNQSSLDDEEYVDYEEVE